MRYSKYHTDVHYKSSTIHYVCVCESVSGYKNSIKLNDFKILISNNVPKTIEALVALLMNISSLRFSP